MFLLCDCPEFSLAFKFSWVDLLASQTLVFKFWAFLKKTFLAIESSQLYYLARAGRKRHGFMSFQSTIAPSKTWAYKTRIWTWLEESISLGCNHCATKASQYIHMFIIDIDKDTLNIEIMLFFFICLCILYWYLEITMFESYDLKLVQIIKFASFLSVQYETVSSKRMKLLVNTKNKDCHCSSRKQEPIFSVLPPARQHLQLLSYLSLSSLMQNATSAGVLLFSKVLIGHFLIMVIYASAFTNTLLKIICFQSKDVFFFLYSFSIFILSVFVLYTIHTTNRL